MNIENRVLLPFLMVTSLAAAPEPTTISHIVVDCSERALKVVRGEETIFSSRVQIGANGCGKEKEGDGKTPIGTYAVTWMISRNGVCGRGQTTIEGKTWCDERDSSLIIGTETPPP